MAVKTFQYRPIYIGYPWRMTLKVTAAVSLFPSGCALKAHVRTKPGEKLLATLTTGNGKLIRVDNDTIEILIDNFTAGWKPGKVVLDLVRTDVDPDQHLGIGIEVNVKLPVTTQ